MIEKYMKSVFVILVLAVTVSALSMGYAPAQVPDDDISTEYDDTADVLVSDTVAFKTVRVYPFSQYGGDNNFDPKDTIGYESIVYEGNLLSDGPTPHKIYLLSRSYGDHVRLRWAPSDYVTWNLLNKSGYVVQRIDNNIFKIDTIAIVKPLSVDEFKAKFAIDDDMAAAAAQVIWGDHTTENTIDAEVNMNPYTAANAADDLDQIFSTAMVLAELRFDIALAMGLGYDDRDVQKGHTYSYIVRQNLSRESLEIWNNPNTVEVDDSFKPSKLDIQITDSVYAPCNVTLFWPYTTYTVYDIERRRTDANIPGQNDWQKVNQNPYLMLKNLAMASDAMIQYTDTPPTTGVYEYRIVGYDSYGTASLPSDIISVTVPDMVPPRVPTLKRIVVDHPDVDHATAHVYFISDTIEGDLKGYMPFYRPRVTLSDNAMISADKDDKAAKEALDKAEITGQWQALVDDWIAPGDTVFHCDVSGLPSGDICLMASDTVGNVATGITQFIFLEDFKAPAAPDSLRANVAPDGTVILRWNRPPDLDIRYYDVYFANDTTHTFMKLTNPDQVDNIYIDSITPGLNQAFIYYEVRAIDYSGNTSLPSNRLRVVRPNFLPPQMCRLSDILNDEEKVYMQWIQPDEQDLAYTRLMRRKRPSKDWQVIAVFPADSVKTQDNFIRYTDYPDPDTKNRYEYAMEAYNLNGVSSGLSLVTSVLHTGPKVLNVPISLACNYKTEDHETVLAWELKADPSAIPSKEWWYCIYRKGEGDNTFKFVLSTDNTERSFSDYVLKPGQSAEYFVKIRLKDGRFSQNSNIIKVTAPKAQ